MEKDNSQERNHPATPKRLEDLRKEGSVVRSRDLMTALIFGISTIVLSFSGTWIAKSLLDFMQALFALSKDSVDHFDHTLSIITGKTLKVIIVFLPFFVALAIITIVSPFLIGGFIFSNKAYQFKFNRINPFEGIKKIFSIKSWIELIKSLIKFILIIGLGILMLWQNKTELLTLNVFPLDVAALHSVSLIQTCLSFMLIALIVLAAIDVPIQFFQFQKQSKMTLEEIRQEQKETDGNPEVKRQRRVMAMNIIRQKLVSEIPKADVIITNPEHYAVALKYDVNSNRAPVLIAKGKGWIAQQIRDLADKHKITIYAAPPLARSLYHTTEIGEEIPAGLYMAVAIVLTYVYQLKKYQARQAQKPEMIKDIPIPENLKY